ncbi:MAG TPA: hypothetical protein VHI13_06805 [Candidatus Kapabacteria bacterium]|nr:hypothetical protein [Candidatus Kapabacteria bacterium]
MKDFDSVIEIIKSGTLDCRALAEYCRHPTLGIRGAAIMRLADQCPDQDLTISTLQSGARDDANRRFRVFGAASLAHVCVKLLMRMGSSEAQLAGKDLIREWPNDDLRDLDMVLKGEL